MFGPTKCHLIIPGVFAEITNQVKSWVQPHHPSDCNQLLAKISVSFPVKYNSNLWHFIKRSCMIAGWNPPDIKSSQIILFVRSNNNSFLINQWKSWYEPNVNLLNLRWRHFHHSCIGGLEGHPLKATIRRLGGKVAWRLPREGRSLAESKRDEGLKVRSFCQGCLTFNTVLWQKKKSTNMFHRRTVQLWNMTPIFIHILCESYFWCVGYHQVGNINTLV